MPKSPNVSAVNNVERQPYFINPNAMAFSPNAIVDVQRRRLRLRRNKIVFFFRPVMLSHRRPSAIALSVCRVVYCGQTVRAGL